MTNKLSIIVPVYNAEKYVSRCVESILESSYLNIELILIDDASSDTSAKICKSYEQKDQRIIFFSKKRNEGPAAARIQGLQISTGDYIGFADADDFVEKEFYEKMMRDIICENADIVIGGWTKLYHGEKTISLQKEKRQFLTSIDAISDMFKGTIFTSALWDRVYKRELFENIVIQKCNGCEEDVCWNVQLFFFANKILYAPNYLYNYEIYDHSISHRKVDVNDFEYEYYEILLEHYKNISLFPIIIYMYFRHILIFITRLIGSNAPSDEICFVKIFLCKHLFLFLLNSYISIKEKIKMILFLILPPKGISFFFSFIWPSLKKYAEMIQI